MPTPWFLEALALGADADARSVRQAYAARLKAIDPAADPEGFAQLRAAYEGAHRWVTGGDHASGNVATAEPTPTPDADRPDNVAQRVLAVYADRMAQDTGADASSELAAATDKLRHAHVDAPFVFEKLLLAALASATLPRRADVFSAAYEAFGWHEYRHLASLGAASHWAEDIERQRQLFRALDISRREDLWHWVTKYGPGNDPIPDPAALSWPRIEHALARMPDYLGLYLSGERIARWKARYAEAVAASGWDDESDAERLRRYEAAGVAVAPIQPWRHPKVVRSVIAGLLILITAALASWSSSQNDVGMPVGRKVLGRTDDERAREAACHLTIDQLGAPHTLPTPSQKKQADDCMAYIGYLMVMAGQ